MSRIALGFANASCAHCVRLVARSLQEMDGIRSVEFDTSDSSVIVEFDTTCVSVESIRSAMERSGYPTRLLAPSAESGSRGRLSATAA